MQNKITNTFNFTNNRITQSIFTESGEQIKSKIIKLSLLRKDVKHKNTENFCYYNNKHLLHTEEKNWQMQLIKE